MSLPDDSSTPTSTPSSVSRSRWGEKLKSLKPFPQKARHVSEFYIQPDDPHRQHVPGDIATGNVILKVVKPLDITHIVICLHGFVQVYKTPNNPGEGYRNYNEKLVNGRTNRAGGYYGNGFVSLFEDEVVLCGDGRLGEGTYQFGYELHFPSGRIPSSIDVSILRRTQY
jgi:arrestin-related trafficking adapter 9